VGSSGLLHAPRPAHPVTDDVEPRAASAPLHHPLANTVRSQRRLSESSGGLGGLLAIHACVCRPILAALPPLVPAHRRRLTQASAPASPPAAPAHLRHTLAPATSTDGALNPGGRRDYSVSRTAISGTARQAAARPHIRPSISRARLRSRDRRRGQCQGGVSSAE